MLRNILGSTFDSTLDQSLTQPFWHFLAVCPFQKCRNHKFYSVFSKNVILAHPPKIGTRFVNTTAQTEKVSLVLHFFLRVSVVSVFRFLFSEESKNQDKTKRKQDHMMQTRKPLSLVTTKKNRKYRHNMIQISCLKWKQTTQENEQ